MPIRLRLPVIFAAAFALAVALSLLVELPFTNPWGIVSRLSREGYNPLNNLLRVFLAGVAPALVLLILYVAGVRGPLPPVGAGIEAGRAPRNKNLTVAVAVLFAAAVSLNMPSISAGPEMDRHHEGEILANVASYRAGKEPYKDFVAVHGLYSSLFKGMLALELFGERPESLRCLSSAEKVLTYALFAFLLARLFRYNHYLYLPLLLLFLGLNGARELVTPASLIGRDIPAILFLILLAAPSEQKPPRAAPFLLGLIPPLSLLFAVDRAVFLMAALSVLVLVDLMSRKTRQGTAVLYAAGFGAGALVSAAVLGKNSAEFFDFTFFNLARYKDMLESAPYPMTSAPFLFLVLINSLALFLLSEMFIRIRAKSKSTIDALRAFGAGFRIELVLLTLSLAYLRGLMTRPDGTHLEYGSFPGYLVLFILIARLFVLGGDRLKSGAPYCAAIMGVILLGTAARVGFSGVLNVNFPSGPPGLVLSEDAAAAGFLREKTTSGESFFVLVTNPLLYYLAGTPPPVRFAVPFVAGSSAYQNEIIAALEKSRVPYVVFNDSAHAGALDGIPIEERLAAVSEFIRRTYAFETRIGGMEIWKRRS